MKAANDDHLKKYSTAIYSILLAQHLKYAVSKLEPLLNSLALSSVDMIDGRYDRAHSFNTASRGIYH